MKSINPALKSWREALFRQEQNVYRFNGKMKGESSVRDFYWSFVLLVLNLCLMPECFVTLALSGLIISHIA